MTVSPFFYFFIFAVVHLHYFLSGVESFSWLPYIILLFVMSMTVL